MKMTESRVCCRKRNRQCACCFLFSVDLDNFFPFFDMPGGKDVPQCDRGALVALSKECISQSQMKNLQRKEHATSMAGLKKIARKVWRQVSAEYLEKLYELLPRRMEATIAEGGSHTKYWTS